PELCLTVRPIPLAKIAADCPLSGPVIDEISLTYALPLGESLVHAGSKHHQTVDRPSQLQRFDKAEADDALNRLQHLCGATCRLELAGGVLGYDSYSADSHPVLSFVKRLPGVYVAAGFSGLGYKTSLIVGEIVANQLLDADSKTRLWAGGSPAALLQSNIGN
ncbi:MAG: FAD-dependent oxidoreductase, partial [Geminicoccaceae bacterium]